MYKFLKQNSFRALVTGLLLVCNLPCLAEPDEAVKPVAPINNAKSDRALIGSIEDDRYIARNKSFSFKLPISVSPDASREAITDTLGRGTYVISMTSVDKLTNYRFEVSNIRPGDKNNSNFTQATAKTFDWYGRLIQRAWRAPLVEIVNTEFNWDGHRAAHAIFKQFADGKSGPRYHIFYLADFGDKLAFLWTNISLPEENLETEDAIIVASYDPALRAKQSFLSFRLN